MRYGIGDLGKVPGLCVSMFKYCDRNLPLAALSHFQVGVKSV